MYKPKEICGHGFSPLGEIRFEAKVKYSKINILGERTDFQRGREYIFQRYLDDVCEEYHTAKIPTPAEALSKLKFHLKRAKNRNESPKFTLETYKIDKIISRSIIERKIYYEVVWKGYKKTTWEPLWRLFKCSKHLRKFRRRSYNAAQAYLEKWGHATSRLTSTSSPVTAQAAEVNNSISSQNDPKMTLHGILGGIIPEEFNNSVENEVDTVKNMVDLQKSNTTDISDKNSASSIELTDSSKTLSSNEEIPVEQWLLENLSAQPSNPLSEITPSYIVNSDGDSSLLQNLDGSWLKLCYELENPIDFFDNFMEEELVSNVCVNN